MSDIPSDLQALASEVRYLRDRFDIIDAIHRYSRGIDRLDSPLLQSAYHPDALDDRGAFIGSPPEFVAWVFPHVGGAGGTAHNISNITCDIDGDQAHTETYVTFAVWSSDGKKVSMGGGRYLDRLERRDGVWGIIRRETIMDYVFEAPSNPCPSTPSPASGATRTAPTSVRWTFPRTPAAVWPKRKTSAAEGPRRRSHGGQRRLRLAPAISRRHGAPLSHPDMAP